MFRRSGPARLALCTNAALAKVRKQWTSVFWAEESLHPNLGKADDALDRLLAGCNTAADPGACVDGNFRTAIALYQADEATWYRKTEMPGNPMRARRAAQSIAGDYRHTFPNADVQGDQFESTNTLQLKPEADGSIRYLIHLEFFNGHECAREGIAHFNIEGKFVDTREAGNGHTCVFEIAPSANGVYLEDPTGWCRMTDCGARGGYVGAKFSFSDRVGGQSSER